METPSSARRITRSQALAASNNNIPTSKKIEDSEKGTVSKSRQRTGSQPLTDITNDSPIIGLAMGKLKTPSSSSTLSKNRGNNQVKTPGSGEALLRGQVKTLLQRVEEEAEFSKLSSMTRPFLHLKSPSGLLAPTPANTPEVLGLSGGENFKTCCLASVTPSPIQEQLMISQMITEIFDGNKQQEPESERVLITRSLLLDFSEKSEGGGSDSSGCSSVLTHEGGESESKEKSSMEDDDSSVWSIQVNASARDEEEEEEDGGIEDDYDCEEAEEDEEEDEDEDDGGLVDALCEEMSKISVANFTGRHTRFMYNSDDELIEGEEVECGILKLKGLPTPKGKHFRFPEEIEDDEGEEEEEEKN